MTPLCFHGGAFAHRALAVAFLFAAVTVSAQPTLSAPATSNLGTGQVTLTLKSSAAGTGYFTLLEGATAVPGSGAQTKEHKDGNGAAAARFGSVPLKAATAGAYTVRNLKANTPYTVCFTADNGTTLQGTAVTKGFTTAAMPSLAGRDWSGAADSRTVAGLANYNSLATAPDGSVWMALQDIDNGGRVKVIRFDGTGWTIKGNPGISNGLVFEVSLAFAPDGTAYLAYTDAASDKITVRRFDGANWPTVGGSIGVGLVYEPGLAFSPDGTPHIVYYYNVNGYELKARVRKLVGNTWTPVGVDGISAGNIAHPSLAFAPDGSAYVAFQDYENASKCTVLRFDGSAWALVGAAGFSDGEIEFTSVVVAPDGTPYVAFKDFVHGGGGTVMRYSGGVWATVGAPGIYDCEISSVNLAIAADGVPWVCCYAFERRHAPSVRRFDGTAWVAQGYADVGTAGALVFAPDGTPYIAWAISERQTYGQVMRFSRVVGSYGDWVAAKFEEWAQVRQDVAGAYADPDGAGLTNFLRYALDLPARGPVGALATLVTETDNAVAYPALRFNRRALAPGLEYHVQASTDLATWEAVSTWKADASTVVTARDSVALGSASRRFLRLQVTLP